MITITPPLAYGRHPRTGEVIAVKRGHSGYWQVQPDVDPDKRNRELGVSETQALSLIQRALGVKSPSKSAIDCTLSLPEEETELQSPY